MKLAGKRLGYLAVAAMLVLSVLTVFGADVENSTEIPIYGVENSSSDSSEMSQTSEPEDEMPPSEDSSEPEEEPEDDGEEKQPAEELTTEFGSAPVKARVSALIEDPDLADRLFPERTPTGVVFEATVEDGFYEGTIVTALRPLDASAAAYAEPLNPGDAVYLTLWRDEAGAVRGTFSDFWRYPAVLWMMLAAAVLFLLCIHRRIGFKLMGVFVFSGILISALLVPFPILPVVCLVFALITLAACASFYGIKYRTLTVYVSVLLSMAVTGAAGLILVKLLRLSGVQNVNMLSQLRSQNLRPDLQSVLIAAMAFAALGAFLVIGNAAVSGAEPKEGALSPKAAFHQGMVRGKAAMIPAAMTLCFAVASALIGLLVVLHASGFSAGRILSDESVSTVLAVLLAGLAGLTACVPLSAGVGALSLRWRMREDGSLREIRFSQILEEKEQQFFGRATEKLNEAVRAAVGETERAERVIEEEETRRESELKAEETALKEERSRAEQEVREENASHAKKHRREKR